MRLGRIVRWALASAGLVACNGILGVESDYHLASTDAGAAGCKCASSEVCLLGACSEQCLTDGACKTGWRCLKTGPAAGACVSLSQADCNDRKCPPGTTCSDGQCRSECAGSDVCGTDQICSAAGVCVGTSPSHDPGVAGGRDGGSSGAGGVSGAGGTTSTGGMTSTGGSSGGTDGGSGDGTAVGSLGERCPQNGATACDGHGQQQKQQLVCVNHVWGGNGKCTGSNNCDSTPGATAGTCQPIAPECVGELPGDVVCQGKNRVSCGPDLVTTTAVETCAAGCVSGACTTCQPGAKQCSGNGVQTCDAKGQWGGAVACVNQACPTGGTACQGVCTPGAKQCKAASTTPQSCDQNGAWQDGTACANGCSGGVCLTPPACGNGRVEPEPSLCFGASPTRAVGPANASAVLVADMNGDSHQDLITHNTTTLTVMLGVGNGTFQAPSSVAADTGAGDLTVADLDADGHLDVVLQHATGVRVFWGDGLGHLASGPTATLASVAEVTVGNLNGDAPLDIVVGTVADSTNNIAVIYGAAGRALMTASYLSSNGSQALSPAVFDANADGRPDVMITNPNRLSNGTVSVLLRQVAGGFGAATTVGTGCVHATGLVTGDLNHDGKLDAVVASQTNNKVCVLLGNGTSLGVGVATTVTPSAPLGEPGIYAIGDLDGDANPDLLVGVNANDVVQVLRGRGDGTLQASVAIPTPDQPSAGAIADFNEDGAADFVVATAGATTGLAVYIATP